jgi:hypothetical protein
MSTDYLEGSPFNDYRIPGLFLAVVIGGANLLSTVALVRKGRGAAFLSLGTGLLLLAWVAIQTAIIGFRHWSQAVWWVTFTLVACIGAVLVRREGAAARTAAGDGAGPGPCLRGR